MAYSTYSKLPNNCYPRFVVPHVATNHIQQPVSWAAEILQKWLSVFKIYSGTFLLEFLRGNPVKQFRDCNKLITSPALPSLKECEAMDTITIKKHRIDTRNADVTQVLCKSQMSNLYSHCGNQQDRFQSS